MSRQNLHGVQLHLSMSDRDAVERFSRIVGVGKIRVRERPKPHWKTMYSWGCHRKDDVRLVLGMFLPWFASRRKERAMEMLELLTKNPGAKKTWTECPYGHPLSGTNLYVHQKTGKRMCRACANERSRRWYAHQREVVS